MKTISFQVGDPPETINPQTARIRYQLEGFDADWRQREGTMSCLVRFYDRSGDQVDLKPYEVNGENPGWNGSMEKSTFTHRRETLTVPPGTDSLNIGFSSAGAPTCVGIYAVDDIVVTRLTHEGAMPETVLDSKPFQRLGKNAGPNMPEWIADGTRPSMAKMINLYGPESAAKVFCILDDSVSCHAEWHSSHVRVPKIIPGERLTVVWNEMYSASFGNMSILQYDALPVGRYRFKVQALDFLGRPLKETNSVDIVIPLPYWKNPWFWLGTASALAVLVVAGSRYWIRANIRRHLQRTHLVEQERLRIARDLHDDLGARLAHITLTCANAEGEGSDAPANFHKISKMMGDVTAALSEVVWVVNPENDHLESLVDFLCRLIHNLCEPTPIRCRIDALGLMDERSVPSALRHHVSLVVKEAVNNVLKHSGASELQASIRFDEPFLKISISDNGKGFDQERIKQGNGLANMRHRLETLKGKFDLKSVEGKGTTIYFEVPIS